MFQVFGTQFLCGDQQAISPPLHFIRYLQQFKNVYIKTREQDHGTCPVIFPLIQLVERPVKFAAVIKTIFFLFIVKKFGGLNY